MEHIIPAVAEVPTGIPTGIPPVVTDAANKVVAEGGVTGALLILALVALGLLFWLLVRVQPKQHKAAMDKQQEEHEKDRDEWDERHRAISDQRIAEIREVMTALNNNTGALNVISQTQADRTASMERLAAKLGEVVNHVGNLERLNGEHAASLKAANETLNRVVWALGSKGPNLPGPP